MGAALFLRADAAWRLGPRPVALLGWHRLLRAAGLPGRVLSDRPPAMAPFLAALAAGPPPPAPAGLPAAHVAALLGDSAGGVAPSGAGAEAARPDWHGPFDPAAPALSLDLFAPGDVRPVWERSRLAALPRLVQAHRLEPRGGHLGRAESLLADWAVRNPPYRGPNWACGQEAALRVLHIALALALLKPGAGPHRVAADPGPLLPGGGLAALIGHHARRIAATPAYAAAQDNNHPVSEAAGLFACGLLLRDGALAACGARRLGRAVERLVAPDGGFAQPSAGYARLLLDTLSLAEWLRHHHGAPGFPPLLAERARAVAAWLYRLTDPATGASCRLGPEDDSALADLSLAGPRDARPSLERAARIFGGRSAGWPHDPGCAWLGLTVPEGGPAFDRPAAWAGGGLLGRAPGDGRAWAVLRTGLPGAAGQRRRFRPPQADLLHVDLWDGPLNLLRDGGTGAYNPPPGHGWWLTHLGGTAGHNTIEFDGADQMPRVSRFLFARWPRLRALPTGDGALLRDHRGNSHARRVMAEEAGGATGRLWRVEDRVAGPFRDLVLRWRLAPDPAWRSTADGAESPAGRLSIAADAPLSLSLVGGWESPAYGRVVSVPVLEARAAAPVSRITTTIALP